MAKNNNKAKMSEEINTPEGVSQEQMDAWQKQYGPQGIIKISIDVTKEEDGTITDKAVGYIVRPSAKKGATLGIYSRILQLYNQGKILDCGVFVLNNCKLGGDERVFGSDEMVHIAAATVVMESITFLSGTSEII